MATDYRKLCIELFGTDNVAELRKIAGKQKTGRKKTLTDTDIQKIIEMQQQGITTKEIAELAGVTVPETTKIIIGEVESVELSEEFAHEKLSPVLAMYKAKDFSDALSKAEHLVADGGYGHTSSLYVNEVTEREKGSPAENPLRST